MNNLSPKFAKKWAPRQGVDIMEHAGFKARLMRAPRLEGNKVHRLPPGEPVHVYPIASIPAAPEDWCRDSGTYICPVAPDWGLWFDWTMNHWGDTAILPSVKGMNPITGQHITTIDLEQYSDKCPVHGCELSHERFCEECGYKWPPQNYVCHPNVLWWDGFRQPDGTVRQFFFSEDEARDVASAVIGEKNTVPAFGFAFFKSKQHREIYYNTSSSSSCSSSCSSSASFSGNSMFLSPMHTPSNWEISKGTGGSQNNSGPSIQCSGYKSAGGMSTGFFAAEKIASSGDQNDALTYYDGSDTVINESGEYGCDDIKVISAGDRPKSRALRNVVDPSEIKSVAVGAGARINQQLEPDILDIEDWKEEESGIIRLYFVFETQFKDMINRGGVKDVAGSTNGYLDGVKVG